MLRVVCFKWRARADYRSQFTADAVNVLRRMVARHYADPHEFVCITDDATGVDPDIRIIPLWPDLADLRNPLGLHQPSCYRRLKVFSADAATLIGPRFVCLDLDTVIVDDVRPLWNRPEDFVIWGETDPRSFYNGSMFLLRAGTRTPLWTDFDAQRSPRLARRAGRFGSDQGWISYKLGKGEAMWSRADGVYSYRVHLHNGALPLPANARMVMFHGRIDPWHRDAQALPWVRDHWGVAA